MEQQPKNNSSRGRGTAENPPNRFERLAYLPILEASDEADGAVKTQYLKDASRSGGAILITSLLSVLEATMRGAGRSHVTFLADSRYHSGPTLPGPRRGFRIAHFHTAGWAGAHDRFFGHRID